MRRVGAGRAQGGTSALALALLVLLPALVHLPDAHAQGPADAWWGPSDRTRPTDGWAIRVPVTVRNDFDHPLHNHTVAVDLDFGALLVKAGWTNQTAGATTGPRGFTLDVDSIRVVEYQRGFGGAPLHGAGTKPTPHRFYEAPFHAARHRDFDASRNPAGTVLFVAEGVMQPGESRSWYVYANPLEFGRTQPHPFSLREMAPLDAYLWGGHGTVHYGYEPPQSGTTHKVLVKALHPGRTSVALYAYTLGRYTLAPAGTGGANPVDLSSATGFESGASASFFVPAGTPFKVVASRPVVVAGHGILDEQGQSAEAFGYVPSLSGSYAGVEFDAYGFGGQGGSSVTLTRATPGTLTVTLQSDPARAPTTVTLSPASPVSTVGIATGKWTKLRVTGGEILVSMHALVPRGGPVHTVQVPALTGGPLGTQFYGGLAPDGGFMRLCPAERATLRVIDLVKPSLQIHPEGVTEATPPAIVPGGPTCTQVTASPGTPPDVLEFYSTREERHAVPNAPVPFGLVLGAGERASAPKRGPVGHWGGLGGVDYRVEGRVGVFGHFNDTRVHVSEERLRDGVPVMVERPTLSLGADGFLALDPSASPGATGRYHVRATKPVQVVSLESAEHAYARYVPGRPAQPTVTVGGAEFRGPLVELKSPETEARQLFRSTGPGSALAFRLDVVNLGRWSGGDGLADVIEVRCERPEGWKVDGCDREVRLDSRATERLNLLVTPTEDDVNLTRSVNVTAKSRLSGVNATFRLLVYVEVKYGVGMWLDLEGGRKSVDPPVGVEPAGTHRYSIVVKNTGSTRDTFQLTTDPPAPGWTQSLLLEGEPVRTLQLDAGESRVLTFQVTAPNAETAPQNVKSVSAQSLGSALAGDVVNTATRIRPKVSIKLTLDPQTQLAAPGEPATFNLTVNNSGNDIFRILLKQDGALPRGWNASLSVDEVDLSPGAPFTLRLVVTPPNGSRAGDLATVKVSAETDVGGSGGRLPGDETSAVVVVRRIHNVTTPFLPEAAADPGETLRYLLPLGNTGNGNDAIELLPAAATPAWRVVADEGTLTIPANASADLPLRISVPAGTPPGLHNLTFTLRLSREATQNVTLPIDVRPLARVGFTGTLDARGPPGRPIVMDLVARNTGNLPSEYAFRADVPPGWSASFVPARASLAPGERVGVTLTLNASRDAANGAHEVALEASLEGAPAGRTLLPVLIARPHLYLGEVRASGAPSSGETLLVSAVVANRGALAAENVTVALVVDGQVVDQAVLSRVPVGQSAQATLTWLATSGTDDVRVVIDPAQEVVQDDRGETEARVTFGTRLPIPMPGPLAMAAALACAALLAARLRRVER